MAVPSVKGVAFQFLANIIEQRIAEGKIDRAAFEAKLAEEDREILESQLFPGLWYPVESFGRVLELTLEMEGRPREQWAQAGFEAAKNVLGTRAYEGLVDAGSKRGGRSGFVLVHLVPLFFNFSQWSYDQHPEDGSLFHVNVAQAESLPDAVVALARGVIEYLTTRVRGSRLSVSSERTGSDRLVFRALPAPRN